MLNVSVGPDTGPPLVLLHGVLRQWSDFVPILPALACRWRVHAVDFRGHGGSSWTTGRYRVADYVEDALQLLATFDQPAAIYGHSLGAMVAAATAAAQPASVRAVVLEDPPFETMGARLSETALQSLFVGYETCLSSGGSVNQLTDRLADITLHAPGESAEVRLGEIRDRAALRFAAASLAKMDPAVLAPIVAGRWLEGFSSQQAITGIQCPALVLQADQDAGGMLADADANGLVDAVADCSLIKFPGIGHLIHWSATGPLLSACTAFLESLR